MNSQNSKQHTNVVAVPPQTTFPKEDRMKKQSSTSLSLAIFFAMVVTMVLSATSAFAQSPNPNFNPNQIAILRWYQANTSTLFSPTGLGGAGPIVFDGQNIWVAGATSNTLSEYSIDGKQLAGPISLTSGGWPVGMASDGANLWITEFDINKVCKVSESAPSAGTCFATGNSPYFDAFDGKYVWVVNTGDNTVEAFLATNPATHYTYATGSGPTGVAFDGKCIWVTNTNDNPGTVTVINPPAGACTLSGTHALGVANQYLQPFSIAYDGQVMWVAYRGTPFAGPGGVVEVTTTFTTPHAFQCNPGWGTGTVVFDGAYIWVAGGTTGVCKSESSLFANPVAVNKYSNGINANQLAFDGSSVWAAGAGQIAKF
jgi:DNA-binding beta-propeller fold protein YncE